MNEEQQPFYKNWRFLVFIMAILLSLVAIMPSYSNGEFKTNLRFGLDLDGGSWIQLQLHGAIAQVNADEGKIIQSEFGKLLNDPLIRIDEVKINSITFTTSKDTTKNTIDSLGFGTSTLSSSPDGTKVTLQTNKEFLIQKYLEKNLNAEVIPVQGNLIIYEIRKAVTEDELNSLLASVGGKVIPPFRQGVTEATKDETIERLNEKFNNLGLKEIPIRSVGDNYILIDLAGVDMTTAREIASKPGKFEIRIQVEGNQTEHVIYGTEIKKVSPVQAEKGNIWGVPFELSDEGAIALREAAIKYGATTRPELHNLIMYLDGEEVFDAPLSPDLAKNIQSVPVKNLVATRGQGEQGKEEARKLQIHLRSGALPVNVEVVGSGQVAAELGSKFKEQILIAGIIALIIVAIFVSFRYKQPNIVIPMLATSFSEVLIILGITSAIGFQLDLATVTGIIAVLGTGIDHLIIITDEVLAGGSMPPNKIYKLRLTKAFTIIFSAAATVIIAMTPLLFMGFGALRGFAIITMIGVGVGVLIARPAYAVIIQGMIVEESSKKYVDEE